MIDLAKKGLDKNSVIERAATLANEKGLENVTIKELADSLEIRSPSLYNHISGLEELRKEIMLYGWKQVEKRILQAAAGTEGYDAIRAMCREFYVYASENKGIFSAMLWYNKYADEASSEATSGLFSRLYGIMEDMGISRERTEHLIRTLRGFLEGFALLVNNGAFGHPADIDESFEVSLDVLIEGIRAAARKESEQI
ncbi:MAG: WHG domain-containing protein [Oscillospiraceae bacterium]|nr:WHG domain-containing protein [Oscillospiraceae bacterium]MDY6208270.1 WHG domain-containing protein [Oscillospiraceae bacterium]